MTQTPQPDPVHVIDIANAFYQSATLFAALDLEVFELCRPDEPQSLERLCEKTGFDRRGLRLLLDACVALRLLDKNEAGAYTNTPTAEVFLSSRSPQCLADAIRYNRDVYPAWARLPELVRTGRPVRQPKTHLGGDPEQTRQFVLAMHSRAMAIGQAVMDKIDFTGARRLLDVGGGPGTYAALALDREPQLRATVIDLPPILDVARTLHQDKPWQDRLEFLPGSYLEIEFPPQQDIIFFFGMFHQHSPDEIAQLLSKGYQALRPGGRVYILDMMTDASRTAPVFSTLFAINMALVTPNGWVFSDDDLKQWLRNAGFSSMVCRTLPPPMPHWLMQALKF
ncbi:MAG: methyltransferase domain-containing protein [Lentisphaerae bacterium]|nr:MAG: methyltransferase domain-containing protein [Lentisphaerota bacterium]